MRCNSLYPPMCAVAIRVQHARTECERSDQYGDEKHIAQAGNQVPGHGWLIPLCRRVSSPVKHNI